MNHERVARERGRTGLGRVTRKRAGSKPVPPVCCRPTRKKRPVTAHSRVRSPFVLVTAKERFALRHDCTSLVQPNQPGHLEAEHFAGGRHADGGHAGGHLPSGHCASGTFGAVAVALRRGSRASPSGNRRVAGCPDACAARHLFRSSGPLLRRVRHRWRGHRARQSLLHAGR